MSPIPNLGSSECMVSALAGGLMVVMGVGRRSIPGLLVAGAGVMLVQRGVTGHCPLYKWLGMGPAKEQGAGFSQYSGGYDSEPTDAVEEASMESFPASDPPGYTSSRA